MCCLTYVVCDLCVLALYDLCVLIVCQTESDCLICVCGVLCVSGRIAGARLRHLFQRYALLLQHCTCYSWDVEM